MKAHECNYFSIYIVHSKAIHTCIRNKKNFNNITMYTGYALYSGYQHNFNMISPLILYVRILTFQVYEYYGSMV